MPLSRTTRVTATCGRLGGTCNPWNIGIAVWPLKNLPPDRPQRPRRLFRGCGVLLRGDSGAGCPGAEGWSPRASACFRPPLQILPIPSENLPSSARRGSSPAGPSACFRSPARHGLIFLLISKQPPTAAKTKEPNFPPIFGKFVHPKGQSKK